MFLKKLPYNTYILPAAIRLNKIWFSILNLILSTLCQQGKSRCYMVHILQQFSLEWSENCKCHKIRSNVKNSPLQHHFTVLFHYFCNCSNYIFKYINTLVKVHDISFPGENKIVAQLGAESFDKLITLPYFFCTCIMEMIQRNCAKICLLI